jgi:hypothetical protein
MPLAGVFLEKRSRKSQARSARPTVPARQCFDRAMAGMVAARIFDLSSCAWRAYKRPKFPDNVNPAHAVCPFQGPGKACPSDQETKDV